ncbi:hypothetical protein ScPMuIL_004107 [Solemya velum]
MTSRQLDGSTNHRCVVCCEKYARAKRANPTAKESDLPKRRKSVFMCAYCQQYLCIDKPVKCSEGYYWYDDNDNNTDECKPCGYGEYQPDKNQKKCHKCEHSYTTKNTARVNKTDCIFFCPAGHEKHAVDEFNCSPCRRGYYRNTNRTDNEIFKNCTKCADNFTTDAEQSTHADNCSIKICEAGQKVGTHDHTTCEDCPKGTYQPITMPQLADLCQHCFDGMETRAVKSVNESFCEPVCGAGEGYNEVSKKCEDCAQGLWSNGNDTMKFDGCQKCPENFTTEAARATSQDNCTLLDCPPGTKITGQETDEECTPCPEGYYQPQRHQRSCIACGPNLSSKEGITSVGECKLHCPSGEEEDDEKKCSKCKDDHFKTKAGGYSCDPCPGDKTSNSSRVTCDLVRCAKGRYYREATNDCADCDVGHYKDVKDNVNCTACPRGNTTAGKAATSRQDCNQLHCVEGFYSDDGKECVECEVGKYKNFTGNTACVDCPSGFETNGKGKTSLVDCALLICSAGEYRNLENKCIDCPIGQFQNETGQTACHKCANGYTTLQIGSIACVPHCGKGEFYNSTDEKCLKCELGSYKDVIGNADTCTKCEGTRTTSQTGSTSSSNCSKEACQPGQRKAAGEGCEDCPKGYYQELFSQPHCEKCQAGKTTAQNASTVERQCIG